MTTTKCNVQIQCHLYQMTNCIFNRTITKNFTIHMETQKTPNSQISLEKEEWTGGISLPDFSYTTKCNLQIQCNPCQITNSIFHRTRTKNFTIWGKHKRSQLVKAILRKKNGAEGIHIPDSNYTTKLQPWRSYGTGTKTGIQTNGTR